ncbi:MAG: hypothetical protein H6960_02495 [Chromatiaceae bacterium]|nr:hypothetical protein [Chromatiaceae bacterium]
MGSSVTTVAASFFSAGSGVFGSKKRRA